MACSKPGQSEAETAKTGTASDARQRYFLQVLLLAAWTSVMSNGKKLCVPRALALRARGERRRDYVGE